jgi:hypothetical protein
MLDVREITIELYKQIVEKSDKLANMLQDQINQKDTQLMLIRDEVVDLKKKIRSWW